MTTFNGVPSRTVALPSSKYKSKASYPMSPKGVTAHNTWNTAPADNEARYMTTNNNATSFHVVVDEKEVVFCIPFNRNAWHAGDGANGYGNRNHISVEIARSRSDAGTYAKAEANGVKVLAKILYDNKWAISKLKKHQDWSGKWCPHRILDEKRWNSFVQRVGAELNRLNGKGGTPPVATKPTKRSHIGIATIKASTLNMRKTPSADGQLIKALPKGSSWRAYSINSDGWINIGPGWISNKSNAYVDLKLLWD